MNLQELFNIAVASQDRAEAHDIITEQDDLGGAELIEIRRKVNEHFNKVEASKKEALQLGKTQELMAQMQVEKFDWFEEENLPEIEWTCSALGLRPGPVHILNAFSNAGKTFFAAHIGASVANGLKIFNQLEIENPGPVLHIDFELGRDDVKLYYWKVLNGLGLKSFQGIDFICKPDWKLGHLDSSLAIRFASLLRNYKLCIIDCLSAGLPDADLMDERVRKYIDMLNTASSESHCTILLLHHEPKSAGKDKLRAIKGSGGIVSAAGGSLHLTRLDSGKINLHIAKTRIGAKRLSLDYEMQDVGEYSHKLKSQTGLRFVADNALPVAVKEESLETRLLKATKEHKPANKTELRKMVSGDNTKKTAIIAQLLERKLVTAEGGCLSLTQEGEEKLSVEAWA